MPMLCELLGSELSLVQAPMAGVQGSRLALAVCAAGGVGSLPAAMLTPDALVAELSVLREQAAGPWNVNFFCHQPPAADAAREAAWKTRLAPYYAEFGLEQAAPAGAGRQPFSDEIAEVLEAFRPPVVSFHFGLPAPALLARVKGWGSKVLSSATTVAEARWLAERGADAVIAQGLEAGGHRGHFLDHDLSLQRGLFSLLPRIADAVQLPVIAAGGIADERGVRAAMALGAAGVQVGSAFLLCPEADTSAIHRAALKSPAAAHTVLTNVFTGRPARAIVNRLVSEQGPLGEAPAFPLATAFAAPLRAAAEAAGRGDFSPMWAGQNVTAAGEAGAAALVRRLAPECCGAG